MKTINFTQIELKDFFNKGKIYFINYNKFYKLVLSENAWFYFQENIYLKNKNNSLPYTKKGYFFNYTYEWIIKCKFIKWIENLIK